MVRETLAAAFQLKLRQETRETEVYVLKRIPGNESKLSPAATRGHSGPWSREKGELQAIGMTAGYVAVVAEGLLERPAFDETGITGRYDYNLKWDSKNPESFLAAVRDQIGMEITKARKPLAYLVVEAAQEPKTW